MRGESVVFVVFFFSSRRRHTRFTSDWSSDVCSSDLPGLTGEKLHSEEGRDEMRKAVIKKIHEVFPEEEVPGGDPWPIRELLFDEFVLTLAY